MPADSRPKWIKELMLPVDSVIIPARFKAPDASTVMALYDSIAVHGQLQPIGVNRKRELLWGRHRLEVCRQLKIKVRAEEWDATDPNTAEAMSIEENLRRRDLPQAEKDAALVRLTEITPGVSPHVRKNSNGAESHDTHKSDTVGDDAPSEKPKKHAGGRPTSPARAKRKAAAEKAGVSEDTVERAHARTEKAAPDAPPEPAKDEIGNPLPPDVAAPFAELTDLFAAADSYARKLVEMVGKIRDASKGRIVATAGQWIEQAKELGHMIRVNAPHALCPHCKLHPKKRAKCDRCGGCGFVGRQLYEAAEDTLRIYGPDAVVWSGGTFVKVAEL